MWAADHLHQNQGTCLESSFLKALPVTVLPCLAPVSPVDSLAHRDTHAVAYCTELQEPVWQQMVGQRLGVRDDQKCASQ